MSLLSRYYYKKFMLKTLSDRMNNLDEVTNTIIENDKFRSRLSVSNETYESAAYGLFASAGEITVK